MKKLILILFSIILLSSCKETIVYKDKADKDKADLFNELNIDRVVEIEGCEYFVIKNYTYYNHTVITLVHKGNCKNMKHMNM